MEKIRVKSIGILILNLCILLVIIEANGGAVGDSTQSANSSANSSAAGTTQNNSTTVVTLPTTATTTANLTSTTTVLANHNTTTVAPTAAPTNTTLSPPTTTPTTPTTMSREQEVEANKVNVDGKTCTVLIEEGDCSAICEVLRKDNWKYGVPIVGWIVIVIFIVLYIVLGANYGLLYCRQCCYKVSKQLSRRLRTAEPMNQIAEGAIDPVMSPAADEFDVDGGPTAPKGKFDKNSQDVRLKHRQYMQFMKKQEKSDADSRKFKKCPPIFIPAMVDDAQFAKKCEDPDNIILDNVVYDPSGNELYEIGSDVDNIELNPSSILTLTEDSQKASTMKTMKAAKTPVTSATQLKTAQQVKSMANAKSSKKSARKPKTIQQPPPTQQPAKSLVEKSFLV